MKVGAIISLIAILIVQTQTVEINQREYLAQGQDTIIITTRQLNPSPSQIVQLIIQVLRAFNFVPNLTQIGQIISTVTQLVNIIRQIREQVLPIVDAINQISQALARIFRCEKNPPSALDRAVATLIGQLLNPRNSYLLLPPPRRPGVASIQETPNVPITQQQREPTEGSTASGIEFYNDTTNIATPTENYSTAAGV